MLAAVVAASAAVLAASSMAGANASGSAGASRLSGRNVSAAQVQAAAGTETDDAAAEASAASVLHVVRSIGVTSVVPGEEVRSTLRFAPRVLTVAQGDRVAFRHADGDQDPHTATFVNRNELPDTVDEVFGCFDTGPCVLAAGHFPTEDEPPVLTLNVGRRGINTRGDSRFFGPGVDNRGTVTAPPGTALDYLCAIHPWMQAQIRVA